MIRVIAFVFAFKSSPRSKKVVAPDVYNAPNTGHTVPRLAFVMRLIGSILLLMMLCVSIPAYPISPEKQAPMSLEQAASMAKSRTGGRVLSAEKREVDGRLRYRIKILTPEGRIRSIYIDPWKKQ